MVQPKNFRFPFTKETAHVLLHDGVFFIPPQSHAPATLNLEECFPMNGPIHVEFCSGNGSWIIEKARANPSINWIAVEKRLDRVRKIWSKAKNESIPNLLIVFGDARLFMQSFMPDHSVDKIYINFPDPWPKRRHAKHKIISDTFFEDAKRVLSNEGQLIFVTDDPPYSEYFHEVALKHQSLLKKIELKLDVPEGYGTSFFHSLFVSQGKTIHYHEITY